MLRVTLILAFAALASCGVRGTPEAPATVEGRQLGEREPIDKAPDPDRRFVLDPLLD